MKRTREQISKWAAEAIELVTCRHYPVYVTDTLVVGRNADGWWVSNGRQVGGLTADQAIEKIISSLIDTARQYALGWEAYQQGLGKCACTNLDMVQGWDDAHAEAADSWWLAMIGTADDSNEEAEDVSYPSEWERWA